MTKWAEYTLSLIGKLDRGDVLSVEERMYVKSALEMSRQILARWDSFDEIVKDLQAAIAQLETGKGRQRTYHYFSDRRPTAVVVNIERCVALSSEIDRVRQNIGGQP